MENVQSCSCVSSVVDEKPEIERETIIDLETIARGISRKQWHLNPRRELGWRLETRAIADRAEVELLPCDTWSGLEGLDVVYRGINLHGNEKIENFSSRCGKLALRGGRCHVQGCALNHSYRWCLRERPRIVISRKVSQISSVAWWRLPRSAYF